MPNAVSSQPPLVCPTLGPAAVHVLWKNLYCLPMDLACPMQHSRSMVLTPQSLPCVWLKLRGQHNGILRPAAKSALSIRSHTGSHGHWKGHSSQAKLGLRQGLATGTPREERRAQASTCECWIRDQWVLVPQPASRTPPTFYTGSTGLRDRCAGKLRVSSRKRET